jgi:hypothetical protein
MNADDDLDLDRVLALYRECCKQSGVEPLADDEARALARKFHDLLAPALRGDVPRAWTAKRKPPRRAAAAPTPRRRLSGVRFMPQSA